MTCTSDKSGIASTGVRSIAQTPASETTAVASSTVSLWRFDDSCEHGRYLRGEVEDVLVAGAGAAGMFIPGMSCIPPLAALSPVPICPNIDFITSPRLDSESRRNCADV